MEIIKIAIADDHTAIRQCLISTISKNPNFLFIFDVGDGQDLLDSLAKEQPDVLLLDVRMPRLSGIDALKVIQIRFPTIRILVLSAFLDETYVAKCLELGVNGYLTKSMDIADIVIAIRVAYENKIYFNNLMANSLLRHYVLKHKKSFALTPEFTDEEIKILNLLKNEKTTEEISEVMHLSKRSIEIKRDKMREKAGIKTIACLLLYAFKIGIID